MAKSTAFALLISLVAITGTWNVASAQETTRTQVRQELIEAENNGMSFVSNASYPEVATIYKDQVAQRNAATDSGMGTPADTAHAAGRARGSDDSSCVGPVSYCSTFFGG